MGWGRFNVALMQPLSNFCPVEKLWRLASRSNVSTILFTCSSLKILLVHYKYIYIYIHIYDKSPKHEVNKFKSVSRGLPHTSSSKNPPWEYVE